MNKKREADLPLDVHGMRRLQFHPFSLYFQGLSAQV